MGGAEGPYGRGSDVGRGCIPGGIERGQPATRERVAYKEKNSTRVNAPGYNKAKAASSRRTPNEQPGYSILTAELPLRSRGSLVRRETRRYRLRVRPAPGRLGLGTQLF